VSAPAILLANSRRCSKSQENDDWSNENVVSRETDLVRTGAIRMLMEIKEAAHGRLFLKFELFVAI
jgi:hypothetical protein